MKKMKKKLILVTIVFTALILTACGADPANQTDTGDPEDDQIANDLYPGSRDFVR